jgi:hypothetical protein
MSISARSTYTSTSGVSFSNLNRLGSTPPALAKTKESKDSIESSFDNTAEADEQQKNYTGDYTNDNSCNCSTTESAAGT